MKKLILLLVLAFAVPLYADTNGKDGGQLPRDGMLIGGKGADGKFHFLLTDNTGAIAISASALPTGAATSAKQDTQITAEQAILAGLTSGTQKAIVTTKQLTGVPSNYTVGTTDATVFTLAAGEIGFIQNLDDAPLMVKKGASASTTSFSFVLKAGTAADDGTGGATGDELKNYVGVVSVAAGSGSPRYIAWKEAP